MSDENKEGWDGIRVLNSRPTKADPVCETCEDTKVLEEILVWTCLTCDRGTGRCDCGCGK